MEEQRNSMSKGQEQAESESSPSSSSSAHPCPICLSPTPQLQESYLDRCFLPFVCFCLACAKWRVISLQRNSLPLSAFAWRVPDERSPSINLPGAYGCKGPIVRRKIAICNGEEKVINNKWHEASDKFCYKCIVQWTKVVANKHSEAPSSLRCPFCKTENFSIIHGYDGSSFERHYVSQIFSDSVFFTEAHRYRLRCYYIEPGVLSDAFDIKRFWKFRKYLQSNPWLFSWLKREIQALMQEEDVDVVAHHMLGTIESSLRRDDRRKLKAPEDRQREFKMLLRDAARPFLTGRTDRFVDEAELFLASGLNLEAYDDVYMQRLGWKKPGIDSSGEPTNDSPLILQSLFVFDEDADGAE